MSVSVEAVVGRIGPCRLDDLSGVSSVHGYSLPDRPRPSGSSGRVQSRQYGRTQVMGSGSSGSIQPAQHDRQMNESAIRRSGAA